MSDAKTISKDEREKITEVAEYLIKEILRHAIRVGKIEIKEKTEHEITQIFNSFIEDFLANRNPEFDIAIAIDHTDTILKEAREFHEKGENELSITLYATWLEHWINSILISLSQINDLSENTSNQILREPSFRAKFTWILELLGMPEIDEDHLKVISRISEMRNGYIHYKWGLIPDQGIENIKQEKQKLIVHIESTIDYLIRYEQENIYGDTEDILKRFTPFSRE